MMHVWWLSFAGEKGWNGGCFIEAYEFTDAVKTAHTLGINPGGECKGIGKGLTDEEEAEFKEKFQINVLYNKETLPDTWAKWGDYE